ncbi:hypothetical protein ACFU1Q_13280 [Brachybacterium paraconglomeratum]
MNSTPPSSPVPPHSPQGTDAPPVEDAAGASASEVKSLSVPGLLAGGAAAATTSVIGGQLGISGTVLGAAITSVISAAVVAFYTDSVNGTARRLKQVKAKAGEKAQPRVRGGGVHSSRTRREAGEDGAVGTSEHRAGADGASGETPGRGRRIGRIALMSVVIALIGMAAVFGVQRLTGTELSPGTGEIQRSVTGTEHVTPREDSGGTTEDGTSEDGTGEDGTQQQDGTGEQDGTGQDGTTVDPQQQDGTTEDGTTGDGTSGQGGGTSGDGSSSGGSSSGSGGQDGGGASGSGSSERGSSGSGSSGSASSGSGASGSGSGSTGSES